MKVAVLADTHAPRYWKACPPEVARRLEGVDLILHAGDVCRATVLEELAAFAPVRAVLGNNDTPDVAAWGAPETLRLDLDGLARPWSTTPARPPAGAAPARRFPGPAGGVRASQSRSTWARRGADFKGRTEAGAGGHGPAADRGRPDARDEDRPGDLSEA